MVLLGLLFVFLFQCIVADNATVDYYVNLINRTQERSRRYYLPEDARDYLSPPINRKYFGEFDYIIIGAGTAGAVVANRLSENSNWKILVLEAGHFGNDFTEIPNMYLPSAFTEYNWGYEGAPQKNACLGTVDKQCPYPRGKGVGGSTLINSLVYARGNRHEFDRWASEGNPGWSYDEVLPYFKKSENSTIPNGDPGYHGKSGELHVEYRKPYSPQLYSFLEANNELGIKMVDINGKEQLGVSPVPVNTLNGRRQSTGDAFIRPILFRENFNISTNSYVLKVLFNKFKEAVGVEFTRDNRRFIARCRREVILTAGSINSPQILQLSGIGPKDLLDKVGISIIQELDVGKHLLDHPAFYGLVFKTNYSEPIRSLEEYISDYLKGEGPFTMPAGIQGIGFYRTPLARYHHVPDLELLMIPANSTNEFAKRSVAFKKSTARALWGNSDPTKTFVLQALALQPLSEGTVKIKSKDPFDYPEIDTRFLSDPENRDINTLYASIELAFKLINTQAFKRIDAKYAAQPLGDCLNYEFMTKEYWYCAIRQVTVSVHHPVGTCKMGPDPAKGAVVDSQLKVHGVKNLRVADASIFPSTLAGNPSIATILVGEIVSDLIKTETNIINNLE